MLSNKTRVRILGLILIFGILVGFGGIVASDNRPPIGQAPPINDTTSPEPVIESQNGGPKKYTITARNVETVNTSQLAKYGKVGTQAGKRIELTMLPKNVGAVKNVSWVTNVRPVIRSKSNNIPGSSDGESLGVETLHQNRITGDGAKVGVIDGGFDTDNPAISSNIVDTKSFRETKGDPAHGTSVAEAVVKTAPDSQLYVTSTSTGTDVEAAIDYLSRKNVDIIVYSNGYPAIVPDGEHFLTKDITDVTKSGTLFVTAAGNDAQLHWEGNFRDTDSDDFHEWSLNGDEQNCIPNCNEKYSGKVTIYVKWDNNKFPQSHYRPALYNPKAEEYIAVDNDGVDKTSYGTSYTRLSSRITQSQTVDLVVDRVEGSPDDEIEIIVAGPQEIEHNVPSSSITAPADVSEALTVAAYQRGISRGLDGHYSRQIAPYSSRGPTDDGRTGIDVTGYTNIRLTNNFYDRPFGGTSAAAPYVAGTAALLDDATGGLSPQETKQTIRNTADDLPKPPNRIGAGVTDASTAVSSTKHGEPLGTITGNIRDEESQPVEGTEVWLINQSTENTVARATTDSNGRYVFNDVPIGSNYMLDAVYRTQRQSNTIQYAEFKSISNFNMNIIEADTGSSIITGKVVRKNGEPIEGARVRLVGSVDTLDYETSLEKPVAFVRTGPQGNYAFVDIDNTNEDLELSASYKIYTSKQTYGYSNDLTSIIQSQNNQIDFVIEDYNNYEPKTSQIKVSNADILHSNKNHTSDHNKNLVFDVENISADNKKDIITVALPDNLQASNIGEPSTIGSPHKVSIINKTDPMKLRVNPDRKAESVDIKIKIPINIPKTKIKSNNLR